MRRAILILAASCALAGDAQRHKDWMDAAQDLKDELHDALEAKSNANTVERARKLADIDRQEEAYWKTARQADAVDLARKNRAAASEIAAAAKAGRMEEALRAFGTLETTCRACHDLHPEKRLSKR